MQAFWEKLRGFFGTSEGVAAFVASVLAFLVGNGLISQASADFALQLITILLTIAFAGIVKKTVKSGSVPFVPDAK